MKKELTNREKEWKKKVPKVIIDPTIDNKIHFPEKLARANEMLKHIDLSEIMKRDSAK